MNEVTLLKGAIVKLRRSRKITLAIMVLNIAGCLGNLVFGSYGFSVFNFLVVVFLMMVYFSQGNLLKEAELALKV